VHDRGKGGDGAARVGLVGSFFLISGAAALVYQVSWQRILALHSGVGVYSVSMIVAAFLAGLGLGSFWGGRISLRTPPLTALRWFAGLELGLGLFALVSCDLYHELLGRWAGGLYDNPWSSAPVHFVALLAPTVPMGMTLPLLVAATIRRPALAGRTIGFLYGINVLGAALGALAAPWILIRLLGIEGAVRTAAAGNLFVGASALLLSLFPGFAVREPAGAAAAVVDRSQTEPPGRRPLGLWVALYTASGFIALSLEILWFRLVDVAVKSTAFTFGTVLAIYLLGLGLGSLLGGPIAVRLARPLRAFLLCQCLLLVWAAAAVWLLTAAPASWPGLGSLVEYWRGYDEFRFGLDWDWRAIGMLYGGVPLFLYGPPTLLMGMSFAILQRAVHDERRTGGFKVGLLQTGNIVGNVAGSLVTGLLLLELLGTAGALRSLLVLGLPFAVLGLRLERPRVLFATLGLALAGLAVALPDGPTLWARFHGQPTARALVEEDASSVVAITPEDARLRLSVNGKGHSWLPFGGIHSQLGAIPAAIHPSPRRVAVIGLGSGDTAWAAAFRRETTSLTVFELNPPERRLLERLVEHQALPALGAFLDDPRLKLVVADGRHALARGEERYDLIEADALRPHSAYSGNLYSVEFFRLCAGRLAEGGLMCSWAPTERIRRSFHEAFPHVLEFADGQILVGGLRPFRREDGPGWLARLTSDRARRYLGSRIAKDAAEVLRGARADSRPSDHVRPNRDLFPRDEFRTPEE